MRHALLALLLFPLLLPAQSSAELIRVEREGQGNYDIYLPEGFTTDRKWPLMVPFHWSTGRSHSMVKMWRDAADEYGLVLAVPSSRSRMRWTKKDAGDVLDMIVQVTTDYPIAPNRIYASGFSAGANFAYRMMLTQPGLFRAVGPFGGRLAAKPGELERFETPEKTRFCIFHGRRDKTIKYKHAVRAANKLSKAGFQVRTRTYNQGHWLRPDYGATMWQCLSRGHDSGQG